MIRSHYDAVVLGGGPAGLAAALALRRRAEVSVLVVDGGSRECERVGESAPPDLLVVLGQLGLTQRFRAAGHAPCPGYASLWGSARVGHNDFILNPMGPAWRLNRRRFDGMLADAALELEVTLRWRTRLLRTRPADAAEGGGHHLWLALEDGSQVSVHASWVIDATGAGAHFARAVGARRRVDDQLFALVRFSPLRGGSMTMQALLEAVREGWWYTARLPDERVITMLVTERDTVRRMKAEGPRAWSKALEDTSLVGATLAGLSLDDDGEVRLGGAHRVVSISSSVLDVQEGAGWSAVGDAASSYDPIAAQGVYKALAEGVTVGRRVADRLRGDGPSRPRPPLDIQTRFHDYNRNRAYLYGLERRWPDAPFWRARRERTLQALRAAPLEGGTVQELRT